MVKVRGIEPLAVRSQTGCSTWLSYTLTRTGYSSAATLISTLILTPVSTSGRPSSHESTLPATWM